MDREEVIRLAREAGVLSGYESDLFQRFAVLVAAAEREECAKIADKRNREEDSVADRIAKKIRARGHVKESAKPLTRSDNVLNKDGIRWEIEP